MKQDTERKSLPVLDEDEHSIKRSAFDNKDSLLRKSGTLEDAADVIEQNNIAFKEYMRSIYEEHQKTDRLEGSGTRGGETSVAYDTISQHIADTLKEAAGNTAFERADKLRIMKYIEDSIHSTKLNEAEKMQLLEQYKFATETIKNSSNALEKSTQMIRKSLGSMSGMMGSLLGGVASSLTAGMPPVLGLLLGGGVSLYSRSKERRKEREQLNAERELRETNLKNELETATKPVKSSGKNAFEKASKNTFGGVSVPAVQTSYPEAKNASPKKMRPEKIHVIKVESGRTEPQPVIVRLEQPKETEKDKGTETGSILASNRRSKIDKIASGTGSLLESEPNGTRSNPLYVSFIGQNPNKKESQESPNILELLMGKAGSTLSGILSPFGKLFSKKQEVSQTRTIIDDTKTLFGKRRESTCCCCSGDNGITQPEKKSKRQRRRERKQARKIAASKSSTVFERTGSVVSETPKSVETKAQIPSEKPTQKPGTAIPEKQKTPLSEQVAKPTTTPKASPDISETKFQKTDAPKKPVLLDVSTKPAGITAPQLPESMHQNRIPEIQNPKGISRAVDVSSGVMEQSSMKTSGFSKIASIGSKALPVLGTVAKIGARAIPIAAAGMLAYDAYDVGTSAVKKYNEANEALDGKLVDTITDGSLFKAIGNNFSLGALFSNPSKIFDNAIQELVDKNKEIDKKISETKPETPNVIRAVEQPRGTLSEQIQSAEKTKTEQETLKQERERELTVSHAASMVQNISTINNVNNNTQQVIRMTNPEAFNVNGSSR